MNSTVYVKQKLNSFAENELIFASRLYRERLSMAVSESVYYKVLERMCKANELVKIAKGTYHLPKRSKYGIVPLSEEEIVDTFTKNGKGTVIGYALYNRLNLTTQIPKRVEILSSVLESETRNIRNIYIERVELCYSDEVEMMIHVLEVLQNFSAIQEINYHSFICFMQEFSAVYNQEIFDQVIRVRRYKKYTIAFLQDVLQYYGVFNTLSEHLSALSEYKYPKMEEIYEIARVQE